MLSRSPEKLSQAFLHTLWKCPTGIEKQGLSLPIPLLLWLQFWLYVAVSASFQSLWSLVSVRFHWCRLWWHRLSMWFEVMLCSCCALLKLSNLQYGWCPPLLTAKCPPQSSGILCSLLQSLKQTASPLVLPTKYTLLAVQNATTHRKQIRNEVPVYLYGHFQNAGLLGNDVGDHRLATKAEELKMGGRVLPILNPDLSACMLRHACRGITGDTHLTPYHLHTQFCFIPPVTHRTKRAWRMMK